MKAYGKWNLFAVGKLDLSEYGKFYLFVGGKLIAERVFRKNFRFAGRFLIYTKRQYWIFCAVHKKRCFLCAILQTGFIPPE